MQATWFDGKTAGANPVTVSVTGDTLVIRHTQGEASERRYPVSDITWPERTEAGSRVLQLPDGSSLQAEANANWSALAQQAGIQETTIVRWQQSTRMMLVALALVITTAVVGYVWGVPLVARTALAFVPEWVDKKIGESFMDSFASQMLADSTLEEKEREQIATQFDAMVQDYYRDGSRGKTPGYTLRFHRSKVGANAFALPGGFIVMTDELVRMAEGNTDMVLGVLAHELSHVTERHAMKMLSQTLLIGTIAAVVLGDYGDLVATVPLVLGQTAYSRDFEREADEHAISMLLDAGKSPTVLAEFFRRLDEIPSPSSTNGKNGNDDSPGGQQSSQTQGSEEQEPDKDAAGHEEDDSGLASLGILISTHPATEDRIRRFEQAAQTGR